MAAGAHPWGLCLRYPGRWQSCRSKGSFVEMLAAARCVNACVFASGSRSVSAGCWGGGVGGPGTVYGRERHIRTASDPFGPLKYFFSQAVLQGIVSIVENLGDFTKRSNINVEAT